MKLVYFSWIREGIGLGEEEVNLPASVRTVGDLIGWLKERGEEYAHALRHDKAIRVAIDQEHVDERDAVIGNAREVALFPPMTGG
ncbi:MAG: molybdopterin converting factor subunit 1 [Rhizobiaceae bacterium]